MSDNNSTQMDSIDSEPEEGITTDDEDDCTDDEIHGPILEISIDDLENALKMNSRSDTDDLAIRAFRPLKGTIRTDVRRELKDNEWYPNPETAPIHIRPHNLIKDEIKDRTYPPKREEIRRLAEEEWEWVDADDDEQVEREYETALEVWRGDVLERGTKDTIELEGVDCVLRFK